MSTQKLRRAFERKKTIEISHVNHTPIKQKATNGKPTIRTPGTFQCRILGQELVEGGVFLHPQGRLTLVWPDLEEEEEGGWRSAVLTNRITPNFALHIFRGPHARLGCHRRRNGRLQPILAVLNQMRC